MLKIEEIKLKQNLVIIEEHPVEVDETIGGVMKSEEQIAQERAKRLVRTGVVIASGQIGELTNSALPSSLTKGKHLTPEELIGTVVVYPANAVDFVFDIPDCKLLDFGISYSSFNGIKFSKESQFVYNNSYNNVLTIIYCVISREALVDIFNQLPDFTGQPTRTMSLLGTTGTQELTEEDIKIATDKNWVVNR